MKSSREVNLNSTGGKELSGVSAALSGLSNVDPLTGIDYSMHKKTSKQGSKTQTSLLESE